MNQPNIYRGFDISQLNTKRTMWCGFRLERPQVAFVAPTRAEVKRDIDRYWSREDMGPWNR